MSTTRDSSSKASPDDSGASVKWFVRKPDGSVYGPETAEVLREWAAECRLVCGNQVSKDKKHWIAAEDLPHLEMNWVAESPDGRRYGPFNILATRELFEHEVLPEDAVLKELKTGATSTVAEQLKAHPGRRQDVLFEEPPEADVPKPTSAKRKRSRRKKAEAETAPTAGAEALQQQVAELGTQRKALEKRVRQQQKLLKQQEDALDVVRRDHAEEQEALRKEIEQLREQAAAPAEGSSDTEQLQEEVKSLAAELSKAQGAAEELGHTIEAKEQERRALEDAADNRERELLAQLESAQADATGLRMQLDEQIAAAAGQAEATGRVAELEERLATDDSRIDDAMARVKQAERTLSNAESRHRSEKADLENRFSRTKRQLGSVELALRQSRHRVSILSVMAATLLVLLFVFVMLYARSKRDVRKLSAVAARGPDRSGKVVDGGDGASEQAGGERTTGSGETDPAPAQDTSGTRAASGYPRVSVPGVKTTLAGGRCTMVFDKPVFSSLATISPDAGRILAKVADQVRDYMPRFNLTVRGHTDNVPLRSSQTYPDNAALGLARAKAVTALLQKRHGLPAGGLRAISAGDRTPPFPNDTPENRRKNRTVVLVLERK
jgi:flagellar motor protein MotB